MVLRSPVTWLVPVPLLVFGLVWVGERMGAFPNELAGLLQGIAGSALLALLISRSPSARSVAAAHEAADQRLAAIVVESAPIAMLMSDCQSKIVLVNRKSEELFGYSREEMVGQELELLIPERSHGNHPFYLAGFLGEPQARAGDSGRELFAVHKDGSEIPVEIALNYMTGPEGTYAIASVADVTGRINALKDLRRSNAELEQFAYVASHDLQEPLRMVASYTELLAQRYKGSLDDKADKYIFYAMDGAKRMQRLVSDLLAYSRVGSQGKELVRVEADAVLRRVAEAFRPSIVEAEARLEVPALLPAVMADETQLQQLFQNLIGNSLKFRSASPPRIEVRAVPRGNQWEFSVADNGIGLDMQHADRIFQMFQRLDPLGQCEGSGIGLAIAKRIVGRHGGKIWLESAPGQGTTIHFTLFKAHPETGEVHRLHGPGG